MTSREILYENYEDALFALLITEVAEEEGRLYLEENDKLNQDTSAEFPETLDKKCHRVIKHEYLRNNRRKVLRIARRVVNKVAVVALISLLLFTTAYALVPEFRVRTLNMLIEITDIATLLTINGDAGNITSEEPKSEFFGYVLPNTPDGFIIADQGSDSRSVWITYKNDEGAVITINICGSFTSVYAVDTEDADNVEQIEIHGYEGLLIEKLNRVHIVWGDIDKGKYINVTCINLDKDTVLSLANSMHP